MSSGDKPFTGPGSTEGAPGSSGISDEDEIAAAKAANRFDIRRLIGGLFLVYGVMLTAIGAFGSHAVKNKAAGINVDLWTGIAMIVFGALMVFWALRRPTAPEPPETRGQGSGRIRRAPAT
jgi:ABC-type amino acid transport substrate-binding protein